MAVREWSPPLLSTATEFLNSFQERTETPLCSGIMLENRDTSEQ